MLRSTLCTSRLNMPQLVFLRVKELIDGSVTHAIVYVYTGCHASSDCTTVKTQNGESDVSPVAIQLQLQAVT